jgi:pimeloyl-ACP methyl ester carboxylesterase
MDSFSSFDGHEITYWRHKGRKAIIFLHPLGTDWTYWKKTVAFLAKQGYGAVVPNLRGHSAKCSLKSISLEDHVRDLDTLVSRLKLASFIMIGCSLGGAIAAEYHRRHPSVKCICINTPFACAPTAIWLYFDVFALLMMPIALFLSIFRKRAFDFSQSKVTNALLLLFKTMLKLDYKGVYMNYFWLRKIKGASCASVIKIVSRQDEVLTPHIDPDYEIEGNHHCVISEPEVVNNLLLDILNQLK